MPGPPTAHHSWHAFGTQSLSNSDSQNKTSRWHSSKENNIKEWHPSVDSGWNTVWATKLSPFLRVKFKRFHKLRKHSSSCSLYLILVGTYLTLGQAGCPKIGTCAWLPHRYSLLDLGRTAAPWLFGCPAASEWAGRGSEWKSRGRYGSKWEGIKRDLSFTSPFSADYW